MTGRTVFAPPEVGSLPATNALVYHTNQSLSTVDEDRVWHFPTLLLTDRSAAFRGVECGSRVHRTAAEAFEQVRARGALMSGWWEPVRRGVLRFGGVEQRVMDLAAPLSIDPEASGVIDFGADGAALETERDAEHRRIWSQDVVITYISRQGSRRHLIHDDHDRLVSALQQMVKRKNEESPGLGRDRRARRWELNVVQAEKMTKEEQLRVIAKTTVSDGCWLVSNMGA
jgi:hypothetical protein